MPTGDKRIRRTVHFSGRVQGVGFRATTLDIARRFEVTGSVRNLADGRVELIAEATAEEIMRFLAEIDKKMDTFIRQTRTAESVAQGLVGFHIEH